MSAKCGTYSGYQAHRKADEDACTPCKDANAAYHRRWRQERPRSAAYSKDKNRARDRALRRLARMHPEDFQHLYDEELAKIPDPFPHTARRAS